MLMSQEEEQKAKNITGSGSRDNNFSFLFAKKVSSWWVMKASSPTEGGGRAPIE